MFDDVLLLHENQKIMFNNKINKMPLHASKFY